MRMSMNDANSKVMGGRHGKWPLLALAIFAAVLSGCASMTSRDCGEQGADIACTAQGAVKGVVENNTVAFKGLPYAAAPVGVLRWQAPEPPAAWRGVRDGSRFGAVCPQLAGKEVVGDEDCLTLNVWKPIRKSDEPLPVMVFLTGGGNHAFSGQGAPNFGGVKYSGEKLVPEGTLFVSFNYRLGALGFLAHPALSAQSPQKISGNYGSLDQIAMLQWVKQNIAAFGGDPKRVFLFGTSAGGGNICALMTAPAARGLFQGAAMQSSVPTGCEIQTLADAENGTGQRVAQALGCGSGDAAACLRGKSMAELVRAVPGTFGVLPRLYGPNVDGKVFPEQPLAIVTRGEHEHMPVIVGSSTDETIQFVNAVGPITDVASYDKAIEKTFGAAAVPRIRAEYPAASYATPRQALVKLTTDALFTCQNRRLARTLTRVQAQPVYRYLFAHALDNDPVLKALGASHTVEHPFFFAWQGKYRPTEADLSVQRLMTGRWSELARTGRISSPIWAPASQNDAYLQIGATPMAKTGDAEAHCDFWDSQKLPWPHL